MIIGPAMDTNITEEQTYSSEYQNKVVSRIRQPSDVQFPNIGQTIIIKENFGKKKIIKIRCTVEGIYKNYILVERHDNRTRESFLKVDFFTGFLEYEQCVS